MTVEDRLEIRQMLLDAGAKPAREMPRERGAGLLSYYDSDRHLMERRDRFVTLLWSSDSDDDSPWEDSDSSTSFPARLPSTP